MANRMISRRLLRFAVQGVRQFQSQSIRLSFARRNTAATVAVVSAVAGYLTYRTVAVQAKSSRDDGSTVKENGSEKKSAANQRELTFLNFASVEYDGNVYMTPEDFLSSIMEDKPRPRTSRRHVRQNEIDKYLKNTPSKSKGSSHLFRDLRDKEPRSGFQIAFNMFDTDGDQRVDKKEFLVLERLMASVSGRRSQRSENVESTELISFVPSGGSGSSQQKSTGSGHANLWALMQNKDALMRVFNHSLRHTFKKSDVSETEVVVSRRRQMRVNIWSLLHESHNDEEAVVEVPNETSLTVHFFGMKGKDVLTYQDFHRFMDNLQTEVLELEFNEFSHGMPSITEQDFARILLRYTILTKAAHEEYLERLATRIPHSQGITFSDFKDFCQFLNNVDDFALAMRIYTYADQPISEADFQRAVKACTGQNLNSHLIHVVFQLFDTDGDGKLSHKEFVAVMKERLHRRTRFGQHNRWDSYKACIKTEMRNA